MEPVSYQEITLAVFINNKLDNYSIHQDVSTIILCNYHLNLSLTLTFYFMLLFSIVVKRTHV